MPVSRYHLAAEAKNELDEIWLYVARESGNIQIASSLIDNITDRFQLLAQNPELGRRRDYDLQLNLRSFAVGNYVIFYRHAGQGIRILHVLHGSRDITRLL